MIKKRLIKIMLAVLTFAFVILSKRNQVYAENEKVIYEYGDEGIVNDSLELKLNGVQAGENYNITVKFTGVSDTASKISLGYDNVTNDQMVENVHTSEDRSGIIDETVIAGTEETRSFSVAAVEDFITIKASGSGRITSIEVSEMEVSEPHITTIYTIGDSLVQTYTEQYAPQTGWGQMLQDYFDSDKVLVENHALGGRSTGSYMREGRLNEVLLKVQEGDYVLIEFGHNDASKQKEDRYVSVEDYKVLLKEQYIKAIEQRGGIPVLVTLVNRNDYNGTTGQFNVSFERYVNAMKETASETGTKLIDLNSMTVEYFTMLNKEYGIGITEAIIYNYAKPGEYSGSYAEGVSDNTHLQKYGAKLVAGMVAEGLCDLGIEELTQSYIAPELFDEKPDTPTGLKMKNDSWISGSIQWTTVTGADFYKVYVANITDGEEEYEMAGYTSTGEFMYEDVVMYQTYKFKVIAVNSAGESEESEEFVFEAKNSVNNSSGEGVVVEHQQEKASNNYIIFIIAGGMVLLAAVIVLVIAVKKKKQK